MAARKRAEGCTGGCPGPLAPCWWGYFASQAWEVTSVPSTSSLFPSCFLNLTLKHTTEGSFKNHERERLCSSHLISRLIKGVHRNTLIHTHLLTNQGSSAALHFHYYLCPSPHPCVWFPGKAITQFTFPKAYLKAQETLHQTGTAQCVMTSSILLYRCSCKGTAFFPFLTESLCSLDFRCSPCIYLVTLYVASGVFIVVKKTRMGWRLAFLMLRSTGSHSSWHQAHASPVSPASLCHWGNSVHCHVVVTAISGSWTPVWVWQSRKTNVTLISGRLCFSGTSSFPTAATPTSRCHSSLPQFGAEQQEEEELAKELFLATAFLDLNFVSFYPRTKIFTYVGGYSLIMCLDLSHVFSAGSENFQCHLFSNPAKLLRPFFSHFQALSSLDSFYLLLLVLPRKLTFPQSIFLTQQLSCIFQYCFSCTGHHSWIFHRALVSSHPSSAFIKVCSISGSEKRQLGKIKFILKYRFMLCFVSFFFFFCSAFYMLDALLGYELF